MSSHINLLFHFFLLKNIFELKLITPVTLVYFPHPFHRHFLDSHMYFSSSHCSLEFLEFSLELRSFLGTKCSKFAFGICSSIPTKRTDQCWFKTCFRLYVRRMRPICYFQNENRYHCIYYINILHILFHIMMMVHDKFCVFGGHSQELSMLSVIL